MGEVHAATHRWTMQASRLHTTSGSTDASKYPVRHGIELLWNPTRHGTGLHSDSRHVDPILGVRDRKLLFLNFRSSEGAAGGCRHFSVDHWGRWLCHCQSKRPAAALRARHGRRRVKPRVHRLRATDFSRRCRLLRTTCSAYARSAIIARTRPGCAP